MTPFDAGHLLGGALWRLATRDDEAIIYAAAYNHRKVRPHYRPPACCCGMHCHLSLFGRVAPWPQQLSMRESDKPTAAFAAGLQ